MQTIGRHPLLAATLIGIAAVAAADEAKQPVTLGLFTSMTITHNFNDPPDSSNSLRAYDTREGELSLDVVAAVLQRRVAAAGDVGFRFDLIVGSALPHVTAASGLFRDPETGQAEDVDLLQGFVSYVAPVGRGLRFDLGKFTAMIGYESIEGVDGWNDAVSRSLLFYTTPQTHTGLRATLPFSDAVTGAAYVVTGCDVVQDNNDSASFGLQLGLARPDSPFSLTFNYVGGPEQAGDDSSLRHQADIIGKLVFSPKVTLGVEVLAGREEGSTADGGTASWNGVAAYLRTDPTPSLALTLRLETLDDQDGNRTGAAQRVDEATLVAQFKLAEGLFLRTEARVDRSDEEFFLKDDGTTRTQPTLAINVVWTDADVLTH
jgi:hypothetical protein